MRKWRFSQFRPDFALYVRKHLLVRAISQKPLFWISPNLVCICILPSSQHLLIMGDLDLHLQGHLALKYFKFSYFFLGGGLFCMVNHRVIFSSMVFKLCANRLHMEMFNISSGFLEILKIKILTEFWRFSRFDSESRDLRMLVRAINKKPLLGISPNLVCICILVFNTFSFWVTLTFIFKVIWP